MGDFYTDFSAYMRGEVDVVPGVAAEAVNCLRVYRNGSVHTCSEVLRSNYPAAAALCGEEFMTTLAVHYVASNPPMQAHLSAFGAGFADWLGTADGAHDPRNAVVQIPHLVDVARLDAAWTQAYFAVDETTLSPGRAATLAAEDHLETTCVQAAAHVSLVECEAPVLNYWTALRDNFAAQPRQLSAEPQQVAVWRQGVEVRFTAPGPAEHALLQAIQRPIALGEAGSEAMQADAAFDLGAFFAVMLEAGMLCESGSAEARS